MVNKNAVGDLDIQRRIMSEIDMLKGKPDSLARPNSNPSETINLRKQRNDLQQENRRLIAMLKDNK